MFSWICPKCGREVPPSSLECPDCAERVQRLASRVEGDAVPDSQTATIKRSPSKLVRKGLPGWLVSTLVALGLLLVGVVGYSVRHYVRSSAENPPAEIALETPPMAQPDSSATSRLTGHIEVSGIRLTEDTPQRMRVRFVVVNHSAATISNLSGRVSLKTATEAGEGDAVASFPLKIDQLGPYEAKDVSVSLQTSLRAYELPDWQFLKTEVEITSP